MTTLLHPELASHAFLNLSTTDSSPPKPENLEVKIFYDVSCLEVFVNARTVLTTRIYPESGKCFGVLPFVVVGGKEEEAENEVRVERCQVWELRG
jgi:beta-fructofuranosidase